MKRTAAAAAAAISESVWNRRGTHADRHCKLLTCFDMDVVYMADKDLPKRLRIWEAFCYTIYLSALAVVF